MYRPLSAEPTSQSLQASGVWGLRGSSQSVTGPGPLPYGGPWDKCRGPVERRGQAASPKSAFPPWGGRRELARADQLPAFPGEGGLIQTQDSASWCSHREQRRAGAQQGWPGVGAHASSQSLPGPLSPGEGKHSVIFLFFLSLAAASPLTHCLAASRGTGVLRFLRTLGRDHRGQGQRRQSTAVARALTSRGSGIHVPGPGVAWARHPAATVTRARVLALPVSSFVISGDTHDALSSVFLSIKWSECTPVHKVEGEEVEITDGNF